MKNDDTGPGTTLPDCPEGKHRIGRLCVPDRPVVTPVPGDIKPGDIKPGDIKPLDCPDGQHRIGKFCVPDRKPGTNNDDGPKSCPQGKHRIGKLCVPDRVPQTDDTPKGCPDGTHRIGKRCVPDQVIKKLPKYEPPQVPKVKIRPLPPKKDPPVIRRTPQLEKFKKQRDQPAGKVFKKFFKNQGGGGGGGSNAGFKKGFRFN